MRIVSHPDSEREMLGKKVIFVFNVQCFALRWRYSSDNTRERIFILTNKRKRIKRERAWVSERVCEQSEARESQRTETFLFSFSSALILVPLLYVQLLCSVCLYKVCCSTFCGVSFFYIYSFFLETTTRNSNSVFVFRFGNAILLEAVPRSEP